MHDHRSHSLLQQLPLTVSPFIHLPTAVTLPYSYQTLPLSLPPSSTAPPPGNPQGGYVVSPSGNFSTTPAAIISSCQSLVTHIQSQQKAKEQMIKDWEKSIEERELMEKRRVAPGYLDTGLRILEPTRSTPVSAPTPAPAAAPPAQDSNSGGGEELDRVFGKLGVQ
ncbi:hypothetical protein L873DRAFT_1813347 [Choiromyces venosus 120613-1]|uniref:Uncharacterized protein n=1 Tax=Choiromyces venosus 120613-1 TaxID=1336337 RepID=A0A3N4JA62_9PEZI|nr:hypothetical protein L873DRAFT_1813347 [Choiromyces venosus 120613-1]